MIRGAIVVSAFLIACGASSAKEPSAPEEAEAQQEAPKESAASDRAESSPEKGEQPATGDTKTEESAGSELPPGEVRTILQLFVNDDELNRSLHLDRPGRFPLKMAGGDLPSKVELTNGNHAVSIVSEPKSDKDPVLVVTKLETEPKSVTIGFEYPVEKIRGTARYRKGSFGWELASIRIVER